MELAFASDVRTTFTIPFQAKELGDGEYSDSEVLQGLYKRGIFHTTSRKL